ncbi:HEAT repeat domain-containing protein [Myceligenerans salitolerans]|uniref:HEAT repeat domain-containing protein n=1 Tax=Myceligenerans salitolerans TaxID=1230528 RepID=A0ABS3IBP0_9MICO|nr:HEAT repeat domain-containing protein [Myceligenerans salitolerans]MBO0610452.1 HEAT repeat domain-containing protein [Myceligenerans salitolerans]
MLDDVDTITWSDLSGAYGPAGDAAEILRGLASPEEDVAGEALDEFFSSIWHQGTVYPVTAAAVPFVVDLAAGRAVHHRDALCFALGGFGDPRVSDGSALPAVREALRAHADALLPLLADSDSAVREAATYAVAHSGAEGAASALAARWEVEEDEQVRAGIVLGLCAVDPGAGLPLAEAVLRGPFPLPLAAAHALLDAGRVVPVEALGDLAPAIGREAEWGGAWTESFAGDDGVIERLDAAAARTVVSLMGTGSSESRIRQTQNLARRARASRSAARESVGHLHELLAEDDAGVVAAAVEAAAQTGHAASGLAPELARLALGDVVDHRGSANMAIAVLIRLRDRRVVPALVRAWGRGRSPDALRLLGDNLPAFDPDFLAAVRDRLATLLAASEMERAEWATPAGWPNGPGPLIAVLRGWGPAAAPALDVLIDALPAAPFAVPAALAAIGSDARDAETVLRAAADGDGLTALRAAHTLHRVCGDSGPLVAAGAKLLDTGQRITDWDLNLVADAGPDAAPLAPRLRAHLTGEAAETYPDRELQVAAARILWRATGDLDAVAPTLNAVLEAGDRPAARAAQLCAEFPPEFLGPFLPALRGLVEKTESFRANARVPAARALWRAGTGTPGLVPRLLEEVASPWGSTDAVDLLTEMGDPAAVPGLRALAEQDARIVTSGDWHSLVWDDDHLRQRIHDAITALRAARSGAAPTSSPRHGQGPE